MFIAANDGTNSDIGFSPITNRHCETEESCTLGDDYYGMLYIYIYILILNHVAHLNLTEIFFFCVR